MKIFKHKELLISLLSGLWLMACEQIPKKEQPPNVLMISIDDLNDWVGILGVNPDVKTPNIDRLVKEGILFTNAHCQAPICGPSRASIMSGLRPSTSGIYGQIKDENLRTDSQIMESIRFLPQYFGDNGFKTIGVGKIFHNHAPKGVFEVSGGRINGFGPRPDQRMKWSQRKGTSTEDRKSVV